MLASLEHGPWGNLHSGRRHKVYHKHGEVVETNKQPRRPPLPPFTDLYHTISLDFSNMLQHPPPNTMKGSHKRVLGTICQFTHIGITHHPPTAQPHMGLEPKNTHNPPYPRMVVEPTSPNHEAGRPNQVELTRDNDTTIVKTTARNPHAQK